MNVKHPKIWLFAILVAVLMVGPTAIIGAPNLFSHPTTHRTVSTATGTTVSRTPAGSHVGPSSSYFPPRSVHLGTCPAANTGPVNPTCYYTAEAAPMGIGDFGVSGTNYYAYNTTEFLGVFAYNHLDIYSGTNRAFTVQLNVVLNFIEGGINYSYWIQDVAWPTDSSQDHVAMSYVDNIWNFSSTSPGTMTGLSGNGVTSGTGSNCYYYDVASGTGSSDTLNAPNSFELLVVSSQNAQGEPVVDFEYKDPTMGAFYTYDPVTFTDFKHISLDRGFFVDGFNMNQIDLFEDAELDIGGPGGGQATVTQSSTQATEELYFWNGHDFQAAPSAWNFGSDTAEATSSDQSIFGNDGSGTPLTVQLNGTTRDAKPGQAYTLAQVGTLFVSAAGVPKGKIVARAMPCNDAYPLACTDNYTAGSAALTLVPGTYHVWDNTSSTSYDLGMCTIYGGDTLYVNVPGTCVTISSVAVSPSSATVATQGTQAFTATPTCSSTCPTGGFTYTWSLTKGTMGTLTGSGASTTFTAGTTAGTVGLFVNATFNGVTVQSTSTVITIIALSSVAVSPLTPTVSASGTQPFTATPTCSGTCPGGITYTWALTSSTLGSLSGSGSSVTFNAGTTAGTVGIYLNATLGGVTKEASTIITVTGATLTSVAVSPPTPTVSTNGNQLFTATPTCSSTCPGSITYLWALTTSTLGTLTGSGSSVTFNAGTNTGTVGIFVNATLGASTAGASTVITVTVALNSVSLSPLTPAVGTGGTQAFTATPTCSSTCPGGIAYVWALTSSTLGTLTGSGSTDTFNAVTTAGTVGIYVNATLSSVTKVTSTIITVVALNSLVLSPTTPTVSTDSPQLFTATPTCSTTCPGSISYVWALTSSALGSLSGSGSSVTFTAGGTAGTLGIYVNATLGGVTKVASTVITITLAVTLSSVTVTPGTPVVFTNGNQLMTATPTCSSTCPGSITYVWTLTSSTLGTLTGSGSSVTFNAGTNTGTVGIFVNATLGANTLVSSTIITVKVLLNSVAISPTTPAVATNGAQAFTAIPACSSTCPGSITYSWTLTSSTLGTLSGSGSSVTFNAGTNTGTVGIFVNATLSGTVVVSSTIITVTVSLNSVALSPLTPTIVTSGSQAFTATPACSSTCPGGVTYLWALTSGTLGSLSGSGTSVTFTAGSKGGTVGIYVNATLGSFTKETSTIITVVAISSVAISPITPTVAPSGTQPFTATPACSSACPSSGITYVWALTSSALGTLTGSGTSVTFNAGITGGTVGIYVNATLGGITKVSSTVITVTASVLTAVTVSPATATVASGGGQAFTTTTTCSSTCPSGTTFAWALTKGSMGTLSGSTGSSVTFTAGSTAGKVGLFVNATLNGVTIMSSAEITISVTLASVSVSPATATVATSGKQVFTATPTCNGTCPSGTTYSWALTDGAMGTMSGTGSAVNFTAGSTLGTVGLFVNATLNSVTVRSAPVIITIVSSTGPIISAFTATPGSMVIGSTVLLDVFAYGGTGTLKYAYSGLPTGCASSNTTSLSCVPSEVGSFNVRVFVNDSAGHSSSATATFVVTPMTYAVTITETGLPSGSWWFVVFNGSVSTSTSTTITFNETNGTYPYNALSPITVGMWKQFVTSPSSGQITVSGGAKDIAITYTEQYLLTVMASPGGGGTTSPSTAWQDAGSSIVLTATPAAGYSFSSWTGSGPGAYSGSSNPYTLTLSGSDNETANLAALPNSVTFTETGLPSGASWYVALNGVITYSSTSTIAFTVFNGDYTYAIEPLVSVGTGTQYAASSSVGNLTVNGKAVSQPVTYAAQYYLTISISPASTGTVAQSGGWYASGAKVSIQAVAGAGFFFASWTGSGTSSYSGTDNPVTLTISGPVTEQAVFTPEKCWIAGTITPSSAHLTIDNTPISLSSDGGFNDSSIGSGAHEIVVSESGYQTIAFNVTLPAGSGASYALTLVQTQSSSTTGTLGSMGGNFGILLLIVIAIIAALVGFLVGWQRKKKKDESRETADAGFAGSAAPAWNYSQGTAGGDIGPPPAVVSYYAPPPSSPPESAPPESNPDPTWDESGETQNETAQAPPSDPQDAPPALEELLDPPEPQ